MKQATGARITVIEDDTNLRKITRITNPTEITRQTQKKQIFNTDKGRDPHKYSKLKKITYILKKKWKMKPAKQFRSSFIYVSLTKPTREKTLK